MSDAFPDISEDMREFITLLNHYGVQYALCGGFAVAYYGFIRTTMDIDILVYPSTENARQLMLALEQFGFGDAGIDPRIFESEGSVVTLGSQPNQIDLLTSMSSESIDIIFTDLQSVNLWELTIPVVSRRSLIQAKSEAQRPKDLIDLEELKRIP